MRDVGIDTYITATFTKLNCSFFAEYDQIILSINITQFTCIMLKLIFGFDVFILYFL